MQNSQQGRDTIMQRSVPTRFLRRALGLGAGVTLLALAACEHEIAPPIAIEGEGTLQGFVYFDNLRDGRYDPADGDQRLGGIQLEVRSRGTQGVFGGAQVTTAADGSFTISGLPLGTHDLFVVPASLVIGQRICNNPIPVSIYRGETQFRAIPIQEVCLVPILQALQGGVSPERVQVRGVVTMRPGQGRVQADDMYIQDSTTGVKIFGGTMPTWGLQIGDRVEISAAVNVFNQELQLVQPVLESVEANVGAPAPALLTTAQVAAIGPLPLHPQHGALVRIQGAQIMGAFAGRNVVVNDGSGPTEVRFEPGAFATGSGFDAPFTPGTCWNITGILGSFNAVAQVKPRSGADITEGTCPAP
jgi:hypothetical protein